MTTRTRQCIAATMLLAGLGSLASAQERALAAPEEVLASDPVPDKVTGLSFRLLEGDNSVPRLLPGRSGTIRLSVSGTSEADSASARRQLQQASLTFVRYGDAFSATDSASVVVSGPRDTIQQSGLNWYRDIELGVIPPSDSAFILIQDEKERHGPYAVWRRPRALLSVPVLYGNLKSASRSAEEYMLTQSDWPQKYIAKISQGADKLSPQRRGVLPPDRPFAIGLQFPKASGFAGWVTSTRLEKIVYHGVSVDTFAMASPSFLEPICTEDDDKRQNVPVCSTYAFMGRVPAADSVDVVLTFRDESRKLRVWSEHSSQFIVALAMGTTFPLNKLSPNDTLTRLQPRVGFNGRVIITDIDPALAFRRIHLFNTEFFSGPVIAEGELYLGLSTLQEGTADTNRYEQATEGTLRLSVPLVDFGRDVALRGSYEIGSTSIRNSAELQSEHYFGLRLGLDAADISGRQSFVELAWGKSENLTPASPRRRLTVQFRVPTTDIVLQFRNNFAERSSNGVFENTSILSAFVPLEADDVLGILGLRGIKTNHEKPPEEVPPAPPANQT